MLQLSFARPSQAFFRALGGVSSMYECRILRGDPGPPCQHRDPRSGRQRTPYPSDHSGMAANEWWRRRGRLTGTETRRGTCAPGARKSAGCLRCRRNPRPRVTTSVCAQLRRLPEARRPLLWAARFVYLAASCYLAPMGGTVPDPAMSIHQCEGAGSGTMLT